MISLQPMSTAKADVILLYVEFREKQANKQ
jgi:hypothetical protein